METVQETAEQDSEPRRVRLFLGQLSWRMILVRLIVNGLTLLLVAILVPNIYFVDKRFLVLLVMAFGLGLLNAFVKPLIQFVTLPFVFATYGFALVAINTIVLLLLAFIFDEVFYVGSLAAAILGGLVMGIFSSFLESLLGLNLPISPATQGIGSSQEGTLSFTNVLFDEMDGDDPERAVADEEALEPAPSGEDEEPPATANAEMGPEVEASAEEQAPTAAGGEDEVEPPADNDDEPSGDER